jgi:hypothetical protein
VEAGFLVASAVSVVCLVILFVAGNRLAKAAVTAFVAVVLAGFAAFMAYASGLLAYVVERFS